MQGKVVFVAPTKPLVNQQIQACYEFMGVSKVQLHCLIPQHADITLLGGTCYSIEHRKGCHPVLFQSLFLLSLPLLWINVNYSYWL